MSTGSCKTSSRPAATNMETENVQKTEGYEIEIPFSLFQYLSSDSCDIQNICRICLSENNQVLHPLIPAKGDMLPDMFTSLTALEVYQDDGLPSCICDLCRVQVINSYEFKVRCVKSDCTLKSLLKEEIITKVEPADILFRKDLPDNKDSSIKNEDIKTDDGEDAAVKYEYIKTEEDLIEDVQYLEELSESDNEALSVVQNAVKAKKGKVEVSVTDADTLLKDVIEKKVKKSHKSHMCSFCSKRFSNSKALKFHIKRNHTEASHPNSCHQCRESFQSDHDLKLHMPVHDPGPVWKCVKCSKEFNGRSMLRRHIQRHMECKRYACEVCGKPFAELYALRRHSRVHTGERVEKRHACHLCNKRFSESGLLAAHVARHDGVLPCVCAVCGKAFVSPRLLASHHLVHSDDKPHKCRYCDKSFRHESTRNTHHRTHTGERPYVCATCGKRFIQNSNLTLHMRTHTGERPYPCSTCGRRFSSGSTLKSHVRTHTGDKPYSCSVCGKRFARLDVRAHMRQHTGERPHECSVCTRRFVTAARLRDHFRAHTGERPFECATCSQKFASKSHLVKHMKTHKNKKKPTRTKQAEYSEYMNDEMDLSKRDSVGDNIDNVSIDVMDGDTKEIIVESTHDDTEVSGEVILPAENSQDTSIQMGTLCLTNNDNELPHIVSLVRVGEARNAGEVKLYQMDQSLLQIHSTPGHLTISKITNKITANF